MTRPNLPFTWLLFLTFFNPAACFNPDLSKVQIICGTGQPECPEGQKCSLEVCVAEVVDMSLLSDQTVVPVPDSGTPPDLMLTGCKNAQGQKVGIAWACPGAFSTGSAVGQCSANFAPCAAAAGIDLAACQRLAGFYVADQPAYWLGTMSQETCGTSLGNQLFYGCGSAGRAGSKNCGSFTVVADLGGSLKSSNGSLASLSNTDSAQGVLCCPR